MSAVEHEVKEVPAWWHDMDFCHVSNWGSDETLCGDGRGAMIPSCPGEYAGEAVCDSCGNPTCPRCAQLAEMEWKLDETAN